MMGNDDRDKRTFAVIGAAMDVHRELGSGFLEAVYSESLSLEFSRRGIPFAREPEVAVKYKGEVLAARYRADFIVFGNVVIELKATESISSRDIAQTIHYLKATELPCGLLLNFGTPSLQYRRFAY